VCVCCVVCLLVLHGIQIQIQIDRYCTLYLGFHRVLTSTDQTKNLLCFLLNRNLVCLSFSIICISPSTSLFLSLSVSSQLQPDERRWEGFFVRICFVFYSFIILFFVFLILWLCVFIIFVSFYLIYSFIRAINLVTNGVHSVGKESCACANKGSVCVRGNSGIDASTLEKFVSCHKAFKPWSCTSTQRGWAAKAFKMAVTPLTDATTVARSPPP